MLQRTFSEKTFQSNKDNFHLEYKRDFLLPEKADKYYKILEQEFKKISNEHKRTCMTFGTKEVAEEFEDTESWEDSNDIVCQIIRVMHHKVEKFTGLKYNFVLVNRYPDGSVGMGKHRDKESCLGEDPTITGISLGSVRDMQFEPEGFFPEELPKKIAISLDHGSIYVMHHPTNKYWTHEVLKRPKVCRSRISLTFRWIYFNS